MIDALALISAGPERFAQVEIRDNNDYKNIIGYYECPGKDVDYHMLHDSEDQGFDYRKIVLVGQKTYIEGLKEKLQRYFPDAEFVL